MSDKAKKLKKKEKKSRFDAPSSRKAAAAKEAAKINVIDPAEEEDVPEPRVLQTATFRVAIKLKPIEKLSLTSTVAYDYRFGFDIFPEKYSDEVEEFVEEEYNSLPNQTIQTTSFTNSLIPWKEDETNEWKNGEWVQDFETTVTRDLLLKLEKFDLNVIVEKKQVTFEAGTLEVLEENNFDTKSKKKRNNKKDDRKKERKKEAKTDVPEALRKKSKKNMKNERDTEALSSIAADEQLAVDNNDTIINYAPPNELFNEPFQLLSSSPVIDMSPFLLCNDVITYKAIRKTTTIKDDDDDDDDDDDEISPYEPPEGLESLIISIEIIDNDRIIPDELIDELMPMQLTLKKIKHLQCVPFHTFDQSDLHYQPLWTEYELKPYEKIKTIPMKRSKSIIYNNRKCFLLGLINIQEFIAYYSRYPLIVNLYDRALKVKDYHDAYAKMTEEKLTTIRNVDPEYIVSENTSTISQASTVPGADDVKQDILDEQQGQSTTTTTTTTSTITSSKDTKESKRPSSGKKKRPSSGKKDKKNSKKDKKPRRKKSEIEAEEAEAKLRKEEEEKRILESQLSNSINSSIYAQFHFSLLDIFRSCPNFNIQAEAKPVYPVKNIISYQMTKNPYSEDHGTVKTQISLNIKMIKPFPKELLPETQIFAFKRLIIVMKYTNVKALQMLQHAFDENNQDALNLNGLSRKVLATTKVTSDQLNDINLDILTGVQIMDSNIRIFIIEGHSNGTAIDHIVQLLSGDTSGSKYFSTTDGSGGGAFLSRGGTSVDRILYNNNITYPNRLYCSFNAELKLVKLRKNLKILTKDHNIYIKKRNILCLEAIQRIYGASQCTLLTQVSSADLYPTGDHVLSLEDYYGDFISDEDSDGIIKKKTQNYVKLDESSKGRHMATSQSMRGITATHDSNNNNDNNNNNPNNSIMRSSPRKVTYGDNKGVNGNIYNESGDIIRRPVRNFIKEHINKHTSRQPTAKKLAQMNYHDPEMDGKVVHTYASQKLKYSEIQKQRLRKKLAQNPNLYYTYSEEYNSLAVVMGDEDELKKQEEDERRRKFRTKEGFSMYMSEMEKKNNNNYYISQLRCESPYKPPLLQLEKVLLSKKVDGAINDREAWNGRFSYVDFTKQYVEPLSKHVNNKDDIYDERQEKQKQKEEWRKKLVVEDPHFYVKPRYPYVNKKILVHSSLDKTIPVLMDKPDKRSVRKIGKEIKEPPLSMFATEKHEENREGDSRGVIRLNHSILLKDTIKIPKNRKENWQNNFYQNPMERGKFIHRRSLKQQNDDM